MMTMCYVCEMELARVEGGRGDWARLLEKLRHYRLIPLRIPTLPRGWF